MKRESTTIKAGRALLRGGAAATMLFAGNALATEYTVTTLDDNTVNDGDISLREAIDAARTDAAVGDAPAGSADGDSIVFDTGLFSVDPTIVLNPALGPLQIGDDVSIDGSGTVPPVTVTIDANGIQAFAIDAAGGAGGMQAVSIADLSITSGFSTTSGGAMIIAAGSEVALDGVGINGSVANGGNADQGGGAIFNAGMLTITGGDISDNSAPTGSGSGGAIFNADNATLSVSGTLFNNNSAQRAGGAIEARAGSTTTLDGVTLDGNSTGPSPGNGGGLHITGAGDATITGGSVTGNSAANEGGGLWNGFGTMVVDSTTVTGNTASGDGPANGGGGIFNNEGTLQVDGATISGNTADGTSGSGGGILNKGSETRTGTLSVTGGAISGNTSNRAG
ncbi:MAG: nuclease, partial [Algiphilus sp.]